MGLNFLWLWWAGFGDDGLVGVLGGTWLFTVF